ncbi:MAG TPA: M56 family metallopeptidase, partial [Bryobacteraceae bacterium]|nr:M56 family metallopeptidase [Bryobacteraceae bacterium]
MTMLTFLAAWMLRSAVLVLACAGLLKLLRVKDAAVALAAWSVTLFASLMIPVLSATLPAVNLPAAPRYALPGPHIVALPAPPAGAFPLASSALPEPRWPAYLFSAYLLGAAVLLLRVAIGVFLTRRLRNRTRPTGLTLAGGLPVHECRDLRVPAALGAIRSIVVLPQDWRAWPTAKLEAVLAHERSHVRRHDPAVQLFSAMHRAFLWPSPLSWW